MSETLINEEQNIVLTNRSKITVTGIKSVDNFDETMISATTINDSVLVVEGNGLSIKDVNLEKGQFEAAGNVSAIYYESEKTDSRGSFIRKLFKN